jgi:hypothetical protein
MTLQVNINFASTFIPSSHPYLSEIKLLLTELERIDAENERQSLRISHQSAGIQIAPMSEDGTKILIEFMKRWNLYPNRFGFYFHLDDIKFRATKDCDLYDWYAKLLSDWYEENRSRKKVKPKPNGRYQVLGFGHYKSGEYFELQGYTGQDKDIARNTIMGRVYLRYEFAKECWFIYKEKGELLALSAALNTVFAPGLIVHPWLNDTITLPRPLPEAEADNENILWNWIDTRVGKRIARFLSREYPDLTGYELRRLSRVWGHRLETAIDNCISRGDVVIDKEEQIG